MKISIVTLIMLVIAGILFAQTTVNVDAGVRYQTTEGWGTSLCWFGNVIGRWSDTNRNAIADLLFSQSGLGINLVRYNIGGGDDPGHNHMGYGKEMEGFKTTESGSYNWNADPGQRWMLSAAKSRIPAAEFQAEAFSNSPPFWMTISGCASGNGGNNLKTDYYDNFADYLTEVVLHFRDSWGITFRTLEPMNEPNSGWGANGGQEGCHFDRSLHVTIIAQVKSALDRKGLSGTKIAAPDEVGVDDTVTTWNGYDSTTKGYVSQINTHVYSGSNRAGLKSAATSAGKRLWQSECDGSGAAAPFDVWAHNHNDIVPGLDIAMRINRDMREMQPDGWIFWQAAESEQAQISLNKNWGLIHADYENGTEAYYTPKKYYAFAQYTKHIRPGDTMIDIGNSDAVAFLNSQKTKITIVQRNAGTSDVSYAYNIANFTPTSGATVYRTSSSENYVRLSDIGLSGTRLTATARAQSVTTYVISGTAGGTGGEILTVNDNTTGTGQNQFEYVGSWDYGSQTGAYNSDNHWDSDANDYYQVRFTGTRIEVYGAKASNHGIAAVSMDGGSETSVDCYAASRADQSLLYTSPLLAAGSHTLKVRVTGTQNGSSGGASITADMVRITVSGGTTGTLGDVNGDNQITIVDALMIAQYYVGLSPAGFNSAYADVNRDSQINIVDALLVAQYYVGLITGF